MKISIITTITDPDLRQDPWEEALECYLDFADEVVVVNGGSPIPDSWINHMRSKIKWINLDWPKYWGWQELPKHLNAGLKAASGDWVIRMDIDQFFHEKDFMIIRDRLGKMDIEKTTATFQKYSIYPFQKFMEKGERIIAINKGVWGNKILFGRDLKKETDLCFPILHNGDWDAKGVPYGDLIEGVDVGRTGVSYWNFDYTFKTKEKTREEFARFSQSYQRYFHTTRFGNNEQESWDKFLFMMRGRVGKCPYEIEMPTVLPKYIRKKYAGLTPDQFGYNGWGLI